MIDISRNKIPQLETLYRIIDLISDLKFNQLQLYIEGSPFAYESFPQVWELETPLTGEEILLIDAYCRERYIELVPNQNSFGHMEHWLSRPEFNHLAEIPGGFMLPDHMYDHDLYPDGLFMQPGTFHTGDPEVLSLLESGTLRPNDAEMSMLLHNYRQLWNPRNRPGGLEQSLSKLVRLRSEYEALI